MCANAPRRCGESQHPGNDLLRSGLGESHLSCPLIKPLIQGRHEKEPFSSQFYVRTYSKSPRYNCCIGTTWFSCWQIWFSNAVGKMVAPCGVAILHKAVLPSLPHLQRSLTFPKMCVMCLTRTLRVTRKGSKRSQKWQIGMSTFQKVEIL